MLELSRVFISNVLGWSRSCSYLHVFPIFFATYTKTFSVQRKFLSSIRSAFFQWIMLSQCRSKLKIKILQALKFPIKLISIVFSRNVSLTFYDSDYSLKNFLIMLECLFIITSISTLIVNYFYRALWRLHIFHEFYLTAQLWIMTFSRCLTTFILFWFKALFVLIGHKIY